MWSLHYKTHSTEDPNFIIAGIVPELPNINSDLQKYKKCIKSDLLQTDLVYRELMGEYYISRGVDFIPIWFEDSCDKLRKLSAYSRTSCYGHPIVWCLCYKSPRLQKKSSHSSIYNKPDAEWFNNMLRYWITNFDWKDSAVTSYLYEGLLKQHIYNRFNLRDDFTSNRLFNLTANKKHINNCKNADDYLKFYDVLKSMNIYECIFKFFI